MCYDAHQDKFVCWTWFGTGSVVGLGLAAIILSVVALVG